jgi:predicted DNA binding CopG/RHH family protein
MRQRDAQITLRLSSELRTALEAELRGRTMSTLIRQILKQWAADRVIERESANATREAA